jgi:hypothetical protein
MAIERALVFEVGRVGPTCSAYEVTIEEGDPGTLHPLRRCSEPTAVEWRGTSLCVACFRAIVGAEVSVLKVVR